MAPTSSPLLPASLSTQASSRADKRLRRSIRLDPQLWGGLDLIAKAQGVSTNALLETMAKTVIASAGMEAEVATGEADQSPASQGAYKGVFIRLRADDRTAFKEQAAVAGFTMTGWLTSLARAAARKGPLFVRSEIEGLVEANRQLAAAGRLLNTVVHRLHREGRWAGNLDLYANLLETVKRNRARVEDVIAQAHERPVEN